MVVDKKTNTPWYIGGLHFACQQCGRCCSGPQEGVIWITRQEIKILAKHLSQSPNDVQKKSLKRLRLSFSIRENPCSKDCIFLVNINGSRTCAIYDVRPMQCRNWPFWPNNLNNPDDWNAAAMKCPGINKGRLYTFDEIEKIKRQKQWWNDER
jgi:Fe-S-cluster containining protein